MHDMILSEHVHCFSHLLLIQVLDSLRLLSARRQFTSLLFYRYKSGSARLDLSIATNDIDNGSHLCGLYNRLELATEPRTRQVCSCKISRRLLISLYVVE